MTTTVDRRTDRAEALTTRDVCEMAGVTYRQIDYWCRLGLVAPSVQEAKGSGTFRHFVPEDVLAVRLARVLVANHLDHDVIRRAIEAARATTHGYLWVQGETIGVGQSWDLLDAMAHVQATLVVNLAPLRAGLQG